LIPQITSFSDKNDRVVSRLFATVDSSDYMLAEAEGKDMSEPIINLVE